MSDSTLSRLGTVASLVVEKTSASKDLSKPYIGLEHIPSGGSSPVGSANSAESVSTNNVFREGDVLFGKLRPRLRKSVRAPFNGYCSTDILVLRPTAGTDPRFAAFVLGSDTVFQEAIRTEEGTKMPRCSWSTLKRLLIYCPEPGQCRRIGEILSAIDQAIEKTEALIEKYQQIKAGLMHDLFTRGIGPDGKLRPPREQAPELYQETPIGWIPKEWQLLQLGQNAKICSGVTLGAKPMSDQKINVPYLRVANVQDGYLDLREVKEILVSHKLFDSLRLMPGDVLMNEGGDFDKLGRGTVWRGEIDPCIHQNHVFRVRVDSEIFRPFFLAYWSQSEFGKKYFVLNSKQSTNLASINSTQLHKFQVACPTMSEQAAIEGRVDAANKRIESLSAELSKLIKQKSGLMQDLLTGKVPVNPDPPESSHV